MSKNYKACPFAKELRVQGIGEPDKTVGWLCSAVCNKCPARNPLRHGYNSVFNHITQSPEVLAPKLVYRSFIRRKELRGNGLFLEWKPIKIKCYKSKVIPGVHYKNSIEAIAATVARLKEVAE